MMWCVLTQVPISVITVEHVLGTRERFTAASVRRATRVQAVSWR